MQIMIQTQMQTSYQRVWMAMADYRARPLDCLVIEIVVALIKVGLYMEMKMILIIHKRAKRMEVGWAD